MFPIVTFIAGFVVGSFTMVVLALCFTAED